LKKVKAEIEKCMTGLDSAERQATSRFLFPESFIGFQGHFPDKKILPGVCQVQSALATVEKAKNRKTILREIVLAKYFAPVSPNEEILCACSELEESGEFTYKAVITKGNVKVSELKLRVAFSNEQGNHT
jgi:3-hydroxyacyl-[acyl-carrier-protein] dehydratase